MEHKLIAFYEQTLDASERSEVGQWIEADPAHKKMYEDVVKLWMYTRLQPTFRMYNKDQAWEKLQIEINKETLHLKENVVSLNWWKWGALTAAVALLIVVLTVLINTSGSQPRQFAATKEQENIVLNDSSSITLFSNATLTVAADFNKAFRTVTLNGSAYFNIAKNKTKPFIIHNNDVDIEVLGTSFTIQQGKDFNTVFVHSGSVKATLQQQSIIAVAKQKIVKNNLTNILQVVPIRTDIEEILQTQTIKVKDMRVDSLAYLIEDLYNIDVEVSPAIHNKKITSTYFIGTEKPEQIIENIALVFNATWKKQENKYIINK